MIDENEQNLDAHSKRLKDLYSSTLANDDLKQTYQNSVKASHNEIKQKVKKFEGNDAKFLIKFMIFIYLTNKYKTFETNGVEI